MRVATLGIAAFLITSTVTVAGADELAEIIARHIEARGGAEAWQQVEVMKMEGNLTAFSTTAPFTIVRTRDGRYYFDTTINERRVVFGSDGETLWQDNEWAIPGARPIEGPDRQVIERDLDLATGLFHFQDDGYETKLLGQRELEGMAVIAVELVRPGGLQETWYLDPDTYLEVACDSQGSDFGMPAQQRSFFDDFRQVGQVVIPFYSETQRYTRYGEMAIASVQLNPELDETLFAMPKPRGMEKVLGLVGSWSVTAKTRDDPRLPWNEEQRSATITSALDGVVLEERLHGSDGTLLRIGSLSYDSFVGAYRLTMIDREYRDMLVLEGVLDDDGALTASNLETSTVVKLMGMELYFRHSLAGMTDTSFTSQTEISLDKGANWFAVEQQTYSRAPAE